MKKLILEDINRIKYISSYNLVKTSEENKINLIERDLFRGFKDLLGADAGAFRSFKGEIDMMLSPSKNLKIFASDGKQLKTTNEVMVALRTDRISAQSMLEISAETFKQTNNQKIINAIAEDIVASDKFIKDYANLSPAEMLTKLEKSNLKLAKNSQQSKAIIKANEVAKNLKDTRDARDARDFRDYRDARDGRDYRDGRDGRDYGDYSRNRERYSREERDWFNNNKDMRNAVKDNPKSAWERLKSSGLLIWKAGAWIIGNALWILLFGGLAYGVWRYFQGETGAGDECDEGFTKDVNGNCVKSGLRNDDENNSNKESKITDSEGNIYNPCTGIYRIGCVTSDTTEGVDNISIVQNCLGLSATGQFNKELENMLVKKINKRSFAKDDIKYICMAGGTISRL